MKNSFVREHSLYALVPHSRWYEHFVYIQTEELIPRTYSEF